MTRALLQLACILLLLAAQQGALTHAIWHAQERPAGHDQREHDSSHEPDEHSSQSQLCGFDLAFGQVLGAANGKAVVLAAPPLDAEHARERARSCGFVATVPTHSRGPPVLL